MRDDVRSVMGLMDGRREEVGVKRRRWMGSFMVLRMDNELIDWLMLDGNAIAKDKDFGFVALSKQGRIYEPLIYGILMAAFVLALDEITWNERRPSLRTSSQNKCLMDFAACFCSERSSIAFDLIPWQMLLRHDFFMTSRSKIFTFNFIQKIPHLLFFSTMTAEELS